jgi:hypothetical protein
MLKQNGKRCGCALPTTPDHDVCRRTAALDVYVSVASADESAYEGTELGAS